MAFNLFDFSQDQSSTLNPFGSSVGQPTTAPVPAPYAKQPSIVKSEVSQTLARRKNIPKPKPSSSFIPTASADEGLSDEEINTLIAEGYSDAEIQLADDELRATTNQPPAGTSGQGEESAFETVGGGIQNLVGGAVAESPNIAANLITVASGLGSAIRSPFSPIEGFTRGVETANEVGIKSAGESASEFVKKYGAYQPESTSAKVGEVGAQIGSTLAMPGGALGSGYKTAGLFGKILRAGTQGVIETGKFTSASEGRLPTIQEASIGAGTSASLPIIGRALQTAKTKLQLSGNLNPAKLGQIRDSIISEGADASDDVLKKVSEWQKKPELVSQWMLDRGVTGTKEQMIEKLVNVGEKSKKTVDDALGSVTTKFKSQTASSALSSLRKSLEGVEGMEPVLAKIDDLAKRNETSGLTLSELNQVKREMDRNLSIFTLAGDVRAGNVKQGLSNIRSDLRKLIETKADEAGIPNIRSLNNETSVSHKLADAIGKKEDADAIRQLVSPFSGGIIGGVTGVGPFNNDSIEGRAGNFLFGALLGSAANSSYLKTKIASGINKMTPSEKGLVNSFIESRGTDPIPKVLKDLTNDVSKSPPIPSIVVSGTPKPLPLKKAGNAEQSLKLTPKQAEIFRKAQGDIENIFKNIENKNTAQFGNKNYVNPDEFREYINEGGKIPASDTHDTASYLANEFFKKAMTEASKSGNKTARIVAGGPGAGKGTAGKLQGNSKYGVVVDKVLGDKEMAMLLDEGFKITYDVVIPNYSNVASQIIGRAASKKRTLPIKTVAIPSHKRVLSFLPEMIKDPKYSGLTIRVINNTGNPGEEYFAKDIQSTINSAKIDIKNLNEKQATEAADKALKEGKITKKQRDELISFVRNMDTMRNMA